MRSLISIANSEQTIDIKTILPDVITELAGFLRQTSRSLKQDALETLISLVQKYGSTFAPGLFDNMIKESSPLLSDEDLYMSHLVLQLCDACCNANPAASVVVVSEILPNMLKLLISPLLQGLALESLRTVFCSILTFKKGPTFDELVNVIMQTVIKRDDLQKGIILNVARCICSLALASDKGVRDGLVVSLLGRMTSPVSQHLILVTIGEIGRSYDLSHHGGIYGVIMSSFGTGNEDVKAAAAHAFGNIAIGNVKTYLPAILSELKSDKKSLMYLILSALKYVISHYCVQNTSTLAPYVESIVKALLPEMTSEEEGVRNMVAECLGRLTIVNPPYVFDTLKAHSHTDSKLQRWTVVLAIKSCLSANNEAPEGFDAIFEFFMERLRDGEVDVRRAALQTLNSIAYHRIDTVKHWLSVDFNRFNLLFGEMKYKEELITKKNLGPFVQIVDEGLPLRKAAFQCMLTFVDMYPEMNPKAITTLLETDQAPLLDGLNIVRNKDNNDVEMLCQQLLIKLVRSSLYVKYIMSSVDGIVLKLSKSVEGRLETIKKSDGADTSIVDRAKDSIRGAFRVMEAIKAVPEAKAVPAVIAFLDTISKNDVLKDIYASFSAEKTN
jgi:cullin-associated NEDD8-dissociated protein 1